MAIRQQLQPIQKKRALMTGKAMMPLQKKYATNQSQTWGMVRRKPNPIQRKQPIN